ncbi:MAG: phage tail protein [Planctomycetota bacterium]
MPQEGDIWAGYQTSEFVFVIDGMESPGVTKISGLTEFNIEVIEQPDGGSMTVHKLAGNKVTYDTLTVERRMDGSPEDQRFKDWLEETWKLNRATQGGSNVRKDGMIIKRHRGEDVLTFAFYGAWIKSSKFSDFEAGTTNLLTQTLELEHAGLERVA